MTILESQGGENKKKSLALKASSSHDKESNDEEEDQDFTILMKKFTKFAKRKNLIPNKQNKPPKYYECGEVGHIKPNYDSSTDSDDDEVANICLMANEEKQYPSPQFQFPNHPFPFSSPTITPPIHRSEAHSSYIADHLTTKSRRRRRRSSLSWQQRPDRPASIPHRLLHAVLRRGSNFFSSRSSCWIRFSSITFKSVKL
ncbi:hypothetical protein PIB30_084622 [Stylosanthes scabra]|uniref:Uncharacterized protein n=1 Tax=Stylosanthes scabra TaxID=79078 RepID=A0ABU6VR40_9FABA|nr:hypothetical protein [Stylosanthes scabra]